ncbi:hypothetical protein [Sodalis sp. RH22]|uniref:hypothetical protein n=1 Tax=unclassified Sodalis (in: enterobacteria) TaxID=2636512 RepID=UPI0039B4EDB6
MIIGITAMAATFASLLSDAQAAVFGAFKPLVATGFVSQRVMTVEDAFERCQRIRFYSEKIRASADEGLAHLAAIRSGEINVRDLPEGFILTLATLSESTTNGINLLNDMFDQAEKSEFWVGHVTMLMPIRREMLRNLAVLRNCANQISVEIIQSNEIVDNSKIIDDAPLDSNVRELIRKSHLLLNVGTPRWL